MSRRLAIAAAIVIALGLAAWYLTRPARLVVPTMPGGNVVLITIDTLRADRVGLAFTPSLNRLRAEGMAFDNVRSAAPLTLVSHTTIMTGTLPPVHGVRENGTYRFDGRVPTLADVLRDRGYRTAAFVSAYVLDRSFGLDKGFDLYDDHVRRDPDSMARLEAERKGDASTDAAIAWLREAPRDKPFFLWVHLYDPHAPYVPPAALVERVGGDAYNGEVAFADAQVGRMMQILESIGLRDRTVVAVTSDHGESLGGHGERTHGMLVYDEALRVPLVIRAPGAVAPGVRSTAVSLVDLAPTLLALVNVAVPAGMRGGSLLAGTTRDVYAETEYPRSVGWSPLHCLTDGRWKLIASSVNELYDLSVDAGETANQADAQPTVVRGMRARIDQIRSTATDSARRTITPEAAAQLRALGYVAGGSSEQPNDTAPNPAAKIAAWTRFEQAGADLAARRYDTAVPALSALAQEEPNSLTFRMTAARALREAGDGQASLRAYRAIVQRWPSEVTLLHDYAVTARDAGARDEALGAERAAIALDPVFAAAHNGLGLLMIDGGNAAAAATSFEQATQLDASNASYRTNLGNARAALGHVRAAEDAYRAALTLDPAYADAANGLGVLLLKAGRAAEAVEWFERALNTSADFYEARLNLGIAYQQSGQLARAADVYRAVLGAPARFARERAAAADLLRQLGGR